MTRPPTRRTFLLASAASAAALAAGRLPAAAPLRAATFRAKKKILILGGTAFLGPAVVRAALANGHELTLFNRGRTNPKLFPEVEKLHGQRRRPRPDKPVGDRNPAQDLKSLENRKWDAVVDTSGYFTGEVEDVCKVLAGNVGQYVYVSSASVYATLEKDAATVTESSPLCELKDKYVQEFGDEYANYGGLKRYCEDAASAAFPGHATLVRPGYIVGPEDPTDRFTYWPVRFRRGGDCLAPGDPQNDLQFVDVRDLGTWIVKAIEDGAAGAYNAVGFKKPLAFGEFLDAGKKALDAKIDYTWVSDAFLEAEKVSSWEDIGCWTPKAKNGHIDNAKYVAAGATFRPIGDTIRDTATWVEKERGSAPFKVGLKPEREQELLAKWRAQAKK